MTEQEEQQILTYFRKYNINLEDRTEFKNNKNKLLEAAQNTIRLLGYAGEELITETKIVQEMFESQLLSEN